MNSSYKFKHLNFINFQDFSTWNVQLLLNKKNYFNNDFEIVRFKDFAKKPSINKVFIKNDIEYKILGVKSYGKGAFINRLSKGHELKMKVYQQAKPNHLFWCKVDTKNGAFGIISEDLSDGIASTNMTFLELNLDKISTGYLQLLFSSKKFNEYMDTYITGTTNRKYIRPDEILSTIKIPLPTIIVQKKLVQDYKNKIQLAEKLENEANNLEQDIEKYLLEELELTFRTVHKVETGKLYFVDFLNLQNWVYSSDELTFYEDLHKSKYKVDEIGNIFSFITRTWNKKKEENKEYIEIGAIDPNFGILETKTINSKKAPSRATQLVKKGDLIIGTTRPYLKKFTIIDEIHDGFVASSGFSVVEENKEKYNLYYLNEVLKSNIGIKQFEIKMTGALYPAITQSDLSSLKIPVPSLEIQNKIASNIEQMKQNQKNKTQQAEILRKEAIKDFENIIFI